MSSSGSSLWVPLPEGCIESDSPKCAQQRGGLFHYNNSATWKADDLYGLPLQSTASLGYSGNSLVGFDNITLGWMGSGGPSLSNSVVTGFATKDFFLGQLGLTSRPVNITDFNDQYSSPLTSLFEQRKIPSLTWSYTAGAAYKENTAFGSLILGGYDATRSDQNHNLTINMGVDTSHDLLVAITKITSNGKTLLNDGIYIYIDSTVPHIWLPLDVCAKFEEVFGLRYDNVTDLYLVNDILHEELLSSNPSVTISLAASLPDDSTEAVPTIDIVLPYGAFDMVAGYPLASSTNINATSKYFPLRRAYNSTQYTLGRTFLQEAYLHVDYGRSSFTLSQTQFPSDPADPGEIIAVYPDEHATTNPTIPDPPDGPVPPEERLRNGIIAAIVAGALVCAGSIIAAVFFYRRLRHQRALTMFLQKSSPGPPGTPHHSSEEHREDTTIQHNLQIRTVSLLDGREISPTNHCGMSYILSPTVPTTISELDSGGTTTVSELGSGGGSMQKWELDAVNREVFEMPAEVAKELP